MQTKANKGAPEAYYLFKTVKKKVTTKVKGKKVTRTQTSHPVLQGPAGSREQLLLPYGGKEPPDTQVLKVPAQHRAVVSLQLATAGCLGAGCERHARRAAKYWYLFKLTSPALTGKRPRRVGHRAPTSTRTPARRS